MGMKQVYKVIDSERINSIPRLKLMMITLANFTNEKDEGYAHSATRARHVGVAPEQIRRLKRRAESLDLVAFENQRGRGKSQEYQLNMCAFDDAIKTPPLGGVLQRLKPHLFLAKTPLLPHENPTSNGGPISEQSYKKGAASAHTDDFAPSGALKKEANRLGLVGLDVKAAARQLREWIVQDFGEDAAKSWFDGLEPKSITEKNGFILKAQNAYRMKGAFERFSNLFEVLDVRLTHG